MNMEGMFNEVNATRIWRDYFERVGRNIRGLKVDQRKELLMELQGHLYESYENGSADNEVENLLNAIESLGAPEDYLKPMITRELIEHGNRSFSPIAIIKGLYFNLFENLRTAAISITLGVGYLVATVFTVLAILKLFYPRQVGYFVGADGEIAFGFMIDPAGMREILGYWIVPLGLGAAIFLHVVFTLAAKKLLLRR